MGDNHPPVLLMVTHSSCLNPDGISREEFFNDKVAQPGALAAAVE